MNTKDLVQYAKNVKILSLNDLKDMAKDMEINYKEEELSSLYYTEMYNITPNGIEREYVLTDNIRKFNVKLVAGECTSEEKVYLAVIVVYEDGAKVMVKKTEIEETQSPEEIINFVEEVIYKGI